MLRHVSTSGTDQEQQEQFEQIHKWMCNAGGISDDDIRARLEYHARSKFNTSVWIQTVTMKRKEDMLMAMWIDTYEARCEQYLITIDQVTAAGNLVKQMPHVPPTVSGSGIEYLQSLKNCREVLKTRLEQYRWTLNTKKRAKVKHEWNILKKRFLEQWHVFIKLCPGRETQLSLPFTVPIFSIEKVLETKDAHHVIFEAMEQVEREMAAFVAHVERGTHSNIQCILDFQPTVAAQYAHIPDDTALYYIGMITMIRAEKLQLVFALLGIEAQRTMVQWRLEPPCTETDWNGALSSLKDILESHEVGIMYKYMVQNTEYA